MFYYLGSGRYRLLQPSDIPEIQSISKEERLIETEEFSFSLESDLEDHLVSNLNQLEDGLILYEEDEPGQGQQFITDVGRIDILAVDKNGDFVVIELKRSASDKSCGQLLRYMGWVRKHIANGRLVRGMIITKQADAELKYAASMIDNVEIKEYAVEFTFRSADLEVAEDLEDKAP